MKHLVIIGVGGFAREVFCHAKDSIGYGSEWDIKGFLDGDVLLSSKEYEKLQVPVLGDIFSYSIEKDDVFICAIADPKTKERLVGIIQSRGGVFINLIHNTALLEGNIELGVGNILSPHVILTDCIKVGDFVSFNIGCKIGHDVEIDDYSSFMGGVIICGFAHIGCRVFMATYAVAVPHAKIQDDVYVGAGSVAMKRISAGKTVFGNPAMPID